MLIEHIAHRLELARHTRIIVGLSGGCDSVVLLHALVTLRDSGRLSLPLEAIHINHQLHADAQAWALHCQRLCDQWAVPLTIEAVSVNSSGKGLEAAARTARYQVFKAQPRGALILLAHHQRDQAETVLFRLMRGAGVHGLSAMSDRRVLTHVEIQRPLLAVPFAHIQQYAQDQAIQWVTDPSNYDDGFDRNFLRNQVLPLIERRWPSVQSTLAATAQRCAQTSQLVEVVMVEKFQTLDHQPARLGSSINNRKFLAVPIVYWAELLRHWCARQSIPSPDSHGLARIIEHIQLGQASQWSGGALRLFKNRWYLLPPVTLTSFKPRTVAEGDLPLHLSQKLTVQRVEHAPSMSLLKLGDYTVRPREGGERCRPMGRSHSQLLKKLLQEYAIEPWLRESIPIIYSGSDIAAVGDIWVCETYQTNGPGYRLTWCVDSSHSTF